MTAEESRLKSKLVANIKAAGHYAHRIEDRFSVGFPDLIIIPRGYPVYFCEAKIVRNKTDYAPTPRQWVELDRLNITPHAVQCVLGFDGSLTYLHPYAKICPLDQCTVKRNDEALIDFFKRFYHERFT